MQLEADQNQGFNTTTATT